MRITGAWVERHTQKDKGGVAPGVNKGEGMSFNISVEMITGM